MADEGEAEPHPAWSVKLESVQRVTSEEPEAEGENFFAVQFEADGPDVTGSLEVLVSDLDDEALVVVEALDKLQDGLQTFAELVGRRKGAERIEPKGE